jgi:hypothetical protein
VSGTAVALSVESVAGRTYGLYRRSPPWYTFAPIASLTAAGSRVDFSDQMSFPDAYEGGRSRAIYYVTETAGGPGSLPRTFVVHAVAGALGVTGIGGGQLLLTNNPGQAEPVVSVFSGTTPYSELISHWRFGHTLMKAVPSAKTPGRYYGTVFYSDTDLPPLKNRYFDLLETATSRFEEPILRGFNDTVTASPQAPWVVTSSASSFAAAGVQIGDRFTGPLGAATVLGVNGASVTLDVRVYGAPPYSGVFEVQRQSGDPGGGTTTRQLNKPLGMTVFSPAAGVELLAIADTANNRVVVWDDETRYLTQWTAAGAQPAAIAADPAHARALLLARTSLASQIRSISLPRRRRISLERSR